MPYITFVALIKCRSILLNYCVLFLHSLFYELSLAHHCMLLCTKLSCNLYHIYINIYIYISHIYVWHDYYYYYYNSYLVFRTIRVISRRFVRQLPYGEDSMKTARRRFFEADNTAENDQNEQSHAEAPPLREKRSGEQTSETTCFLFPALPSPAFPTTAVVHPVSLRLSTFHFSLFFVLIRLSPFLLLPPIFLCFSQLTLPDSHLHSILRLFHSG